MMGEVAKRCAAVDASLHLVSPAFASDDPAFLAAGPADWDALDWWVHPMWRDFRDAMSRERCLYFAADSDRDAHTGFHRGEYFGFLQLTEKFSCYATSGMTGRSYCCRGAHW